MKEFWYGIKDKCCKKESNLEPYENSLSEGQLFKCTVCNRLHRRVIIS